MKEEKFGSVSLPVQEANGPFVPQLLPYEDHDGILEVLAFSIEQNMPTLLIGETGVGKTSAVRFIASTLNQNLRRVNVNGSMTAEDFVGQKLVRPAKNGVETYWTDGVLTECVRNGYWIIIDEINAASAEILFALHSLLDDDRYLVLTDHPEREIVRAHPNFRIFATMNPPERYSGTKEMNKALLSRFPITITVPIPPEHIEFGTISNAKNVLKEEYKLNGLKEFVKAMRATYEKEEMEVFFSPRDTANVIKLYQFTGSLLEAVEKTIVPRGTRSEQSAILELARLHFTKKKEEDAVEPKKKALESLRIGDVVSTQLMTDFLKDNSGEMTMDGGFNVYNKDGWKFHFSYNYDEYHYTLMSVEPLNSIKGVSSVGGVGKSSTSVTDSDIDEIEMIKKKVFMGALEDMRAKIDGLKPEEESK